MNDSPRSDPAEKPFPTSATMVIGGLLLTILGASWHFLSPRIKAGREKLANHRKSR